MASEPNQETQSTDTAKGKNWTEWRDAFFSDISKKTGWSATIEKIRKELRKMKEGWILLIVLALFVIGGTFGVTSSYLIKKHVLEETQSTKSFNDTIGRRDIAQHKLELELSDTKAELNTAKLTITQLQLARGTQGNAGSGNEKIDRILDAVDLKDELNREISNLSFLLAFRSPLSAKNFKDQGFSIRITLSYLPGPNLSQRKFLVLVGEIGPSSAKELDWSMHMAIYARNVYSPQTIPDSGWTFPYRVFTGVDLLPELPLPFSFKYSNTSPPFLMLRDLHDATISISITPELAKEISHMDLIANPSRDWQKRVRLFTMNISSSDWSDTESDLDISHSLDRVDDLPHFLKMKTIKSESMFGSTIDIDKALIEKNALKLPDVLRKPYR